MRTDRESTFSLLRLLSEPKIYIHQAGQDVNKCVSVTVCINSHKLPVGAENSQQRSAFLEQDNGVRNKENSSRLVSSHFCRVFCSVAGAVRCQQLVIRILWRHPAPGLSGQSQRQSIFIPIRGPTCIELSSLNTSYKCQFSPNKY